MDEQEHAVIHMNEKIAQLEAARDLLVSTKRTLQLLDEQIDVLSNGRIAVQPDEDVSSEHRAAWLGATDDNDHLNGIKFATDGGGVGAIPVGIGNPLHGTIRNQEDAAFVCTNIFVASQTQIQAQGDDQIVFTEGGLTLSSFLVRFTDLNTGRNLVSGFTEGPLDLDRGAIPLTYLWSLRAGLGPFTKNKFFAEFTIPRAAAVRVELFNTVGASITNLGVLRVFFTLVGFKVYGA